MQSQLNLRDDTTRTPILVQSIPGTLIVIDMQPGFPLSCSVRRDVEAEILKAIACGWAIVIVEFDTEAACDTHASLLKLLDGCVHHTLVKKTKEDGSDVVLEALQRLAYPTQLLRICGVMTDICVQQTAAGLAVALPTARIEVVKSACTTAIQPYDWATFNSPNGIILV